MLEVYDYFNFQNSEMTFILNRNLIFKLSNLQIFKL